VLLVAPAQRIVLELVAAEEPEQLCLALGTDVEPAEHPLLVVLVGQPEPPPQPPDGGVLSQE
jgi:hypothetical protein